LLSHEDESVRAAALHALARMDRLGVDDVDRALRDPSAHVRRRALADAIATTVDLRPLLLDADATVAEQAAWALGEREERDAVPDLIAAASHRDALVREAAVAALGAIQDERARATILKATTDKPAIRRRAVLALASFDGRDVDDALQRASEDHDWQVRDAAQVIRDAKGAAPEDGP
jgi:HEAT repeat protein